MNLGTNPALIVVDMQNAFCSERGSLQGIGLDHTASAAAVQPVARLVRAARAAGIPIFFTRYTLREDYSDAGLLADQFPALKEVGALVEGSWDNAIVDELEPQPGEHVIDKTRYSAFFGTDLEDQLKQLGVDTLIVCGVTTNVCVESTVRDAFFRDIRVIVPADATGAVTPELHEGALRNFEYGLGTVTTVDEIENALAERSSVGAR